VLSVLFPPKGPKGSELHTRTHRFEICKEISLNLAPALIYFNPVRWSVNMVSITPRVPFTFTVSVRKGLWTHTPALFLVNSNPYTNQNLLFACQWLCVYWNVNPDDKQPRTLRLGWVRNTKNLFASIKLNCTLAAA
jgi:hypothetical protein